MSIMRSSDGGIKMPKIEIYDTRAEWIHIFGLLLAILFGLLHCCCTTDGMCCLTCANQCVSFEMKHT